MNLYTALTRMSNSRNHLQKLYHYCGLTGLVSRKIERSVQERHDNFLNKKCLSGKYFSVGSTEDLTVDIRAHKLPPMVNSLFEEMILDGTTDESRFELKGKIRIDYTESEIFQQVLTFMDKYNDRFKDEVQLSSKFAIPLWKAATKHKLKDLAEKCIDHLENNVTVENVCDVLNFSISFHKLALKKNSLNLISIKTQDVLNSPGFVTLSREAWKAVMELDKTSVSKYSLMEAGVRWAKHQLHLEESIDCPTVEDIFKILGDLNHKICFSAFIKKEKIEADFEHNLKDIREKCMFHLENNIKVENVCDVLNFSFSFQKMALQEISLNLISIKTQDVFNSPGIVRLSREALNAVFELVQTSVSEYSLLKACVCWAKHKLHVDELIDCPTVEEIFNILGHLRFKIRLSVINKEEIEADFEEVISVLSEQMKCIASGTNCRNGKGIGEVCFNLHEEVEQCFTNNDSDILKIAVNESDCLLTGLYVYSAAGYDDYLAKVAEGSGNFVEGCRDVATQKPGYYSADIIVIRFADYYGCHDPDTYDETVYLETVIVPYTGSSEPYRITFKEPVRLQRFNEYDIQIRSIRGGGIGYIGKKYRNELRDYFLYFGECKLIPGVHYVPEV